MSCPPWSRSPEVRNIQKLRDKAQHQALKSGSPTHWCEYRKLRNKATSMLRELVSQLIWDTVKRGIRNSGIAE